MNCVQLTPPPPNPKEFVPLNLFKASSINSTFSIQLFHPDSRVYFVSYLCHGMVRAVIKLVLSKLYNYFELITFCYSYLGRQQINLTKLFVLGVCFRSSIEISRAQCKLDSKLPLCVQEHQRIFVVFVLWYSGNSHEGRGGCGGLEVIQNGKYDNIEFLRENYFKICYTFNPKSLEGGGGDKLNPPQFFWL